MTTALRRSDLRFRLPLNNTFGVVIGAVSNAVLWAELSARGASEKLV